MSNASQIEQDAKSGNSVWDIVRYVVILVLIGFAIWYYYIKKPIVYAAQETHGTTMGCGYSVKVADFVKGNDHDAWKKFAKLIQQRLDDVNHAMSTYRSDSEVCRFNASDSTDWFSVSKETVEVVQLAQKISKLSSGAFDITVAPLVDLWGFGPDKSVLTTAELETKSAELKFRIGYEKLEVRSTPPALKKPIPELHIDLSAIAKGYGVDCIANLLEEHGYVNYMVEVGGEVRCRGKKGAENNWNIGIEKPLLGELNSFPGLQRKLQLDNRAMATSGDYQNYREIDGKKYSHIIDPRTGFPTEQLAVGVPEPTERLGSVSVIAETCAQADALATAMFVLGERQGLELAEKQGLAVLFLLRSENKETPIRESASATFPK